MAARTLLAGIDAGLACDPVPQEPAMTRSVRSLAFLSLGACLFSLAACSSTGAPSGDQTKNEPGPQGAYGLTENVGTMEEDVIQSDDANQDPFANDPSPVPN